jgi:hypothetical protein
MTSSMLGTDISMNTFQFHGGDYSITPPQISPKSGKLLINDTLHRIISSLITHPGLNTVSTS